MNLHNPILFLASILLLSSSASADSLNLFKVQPISNFPIKCAAAYNFDISDCTSSEITVSGKIERDGRGACSSQCVAALSTINNNLSRACAGVQASPSTLIGLFFAGQGVTYLCPNSVEGNGPAPSSTGEESTAAATSSSSSSSSGSSASTTLTTVTSATTSASSESTATPTTPTPSPSFQPTTAVNNGVATVLTSEAQRSDSSNPDAFGGGGSPFEVAANAASASARVRNGVPVVLFAALSWSFVAGCWILVGG